MTEHRKPIRHHVQTSDPTIKAVSSALRDRAGVIPKINPGMMSVTAVVACVVAASFSTTSAHTTSAHTNAALANSSANNTTVTHTDEDSEPSAEPVDESSDTESASRRVLVVLVDGRRFEGDLIERTPALVVLRIDGVRSAFPTESVASVRDAQSIRDRYTALRRGVGDDPDQIVELAEWLRANGELGLALIEVERALAISPQHGPSLRLYSIIEQNIILRARQVDRQAGKPPPADDEENRLLAQGFPLLNDAQVNLLRVYEIDFANPGRILIDRRVVDEFIDVYRNHPLLPATSEGREALRRSSPEHIIRLIFQVQARDFYSRVRVLDDPPALRIFRDDVNAGWLVNSCATNQCHGGAEAGRLMLANRSKRSATVAYTNFLILDRFRMDDGRPLLDYQSPERSPLLHLGLPRKESMVPHPPVIRGRLGRDVWQPVFRTNRDRSYRRAMTWIASLYTPRPAYPIDYTPPAPLLPQHEDSDNQDPGSAPAPTPRPRRDRDTPSQDPEQQPTPVPGHDPIPTGGQDPPPTGPFDTTQPERPQPQPR